ncbi:P2Y purinoceptor 14-like [Pristis pectinata]|uniref:P2Y purinoceptor 14-like n=1 Tax=Pristis pectinata TaxID=685728 RepID=UPI00223D32CC|nr:P2Y purinoceptor 14-like [Pristis pectinata]
MNNSKHSSNITNCSDLRNPTVTRMVIPLLYVIVFIGGFLLNVLAAWIFCQIPSQSSFVIYLKNIVAADLLLVVTLPFKILSTSPHRIWQLEAFVCRYSAVMFYTSMYISIIFLGLISLDRYLKIVQPQKILVVQKVTVAKAISVGCWVFMLSFALPSIVLTNKVPTVQTAAACMKLKSKMGVAWHHFIIIKCKVIFWIVFVLLTLCYLAILKKIYWSKQKFQKDSSTVVKKANRNIFSILGVFFVCFVPYQFIRIPYDRRRLTKHDCATLNSLYYAKEFTLFLCAFNVCLDPVIYFLLCKSFTKLLCRKLKLKRSLTIKTGEVRNKPQSSNTSNQSPISSQVMVELVKTNSSRLPSDKSTMKSIRINIPQKSPAVSTLSSQVEQNEKGTKALYVSHIF